MLKKKYFVLAPSSLDAKNTELLHQRAMTYYGNRDYEDISNDSELLDTINKMFLDYCEECNAVLLLVGLSAIAIALSDSVYISKNWEEDDCCKMCHALAFSHGIDIVYEPI